MRSHVLHVIPFLWSGAGGVLTRLCEAQRRRWRVTIVTGGSRGENPDWPAYRSRLRRAGVAHHTIDFYQRSEFWKSTGQLADLVRDLHPSVIHAHAGVPAAAASIARAMTGSGARVVGQMYSWGPDRPEWMNQQDMWGFAQTDRVVCSARAYETLLLEYGVPKRKLTYLPWGLPLGALPFASRNLELRNENREPRTQNPEPRTQNPLVGFVGRIEPRKRQLELVHAFARWRRHVPDARLELVGPVTDRAYAARIRSAISRAGLSHVVTITGEVADVVFRVREWDLFVSLSSDEGQGLAVLEAMAIGVPVVARPVAGISDFLIDRRNGFAIKDDEIRTAALAMLRAWKSNRRAIVRNARAMVERRYDWNHTVAAFERIYR